MNTDVFMLEGRAFSWRGLCELRRQQLEAIRKARGTQPALFALLTDHRPATEKTAALRDGFRGPCVPQVKHGMYLITKTNWNQRSNCSKYSEMFKNPPSCVFYENKLIRQPRQWSNGRLST